MLRFIELFFCCVFLAYCNICSGQAGQLDPSLTIGTGPNAPVNVTLVQPDGKILVGGSSVTTYNGQPVNRLFRILADGTLDDSFNIGAGPDSDVYCMALQADGKILVGGFFTSFNAQAANRLVRLNPDGSTDTSFSLSSDPGHGVSSVLVQPDGKVLISGQFYSPGFRYVSRLNADGSPDSTFNVGTGPNSGNTCFALQSDGKIIIGGRFQTVNDVPNNRIARLNPDGSLDSSFNAGTGFTNGGVFALALQQGKILVAGEFTQWNGTDKGRLVRLNTDGSVDNGFQAGVGVNTPNNTDWIGSLKVLADGKIIIAGDFTNYQFSAVNRLALLTPEGLLDSSFNVGTGSNFSVYSVSVQQDNKLVIGGAFTTYNNLNASRLARIYGQTLATDQFSYPGKVLLYPNPSKGVFNISGYETTEKTISVYDNLGRKVIVVPATAVYTTIDATLLPAGLYSVKAGEKVAKILISR